ncbi:MAG: hypothetical protein Q4G05_02545 [Clostridia bacterium]|nr:hypothetical protein [Clostridia bacterium]
MKENRGITLVALSIMIVVMLMLSGLALYYSNGDNGVMKVMKETEFKTYMKIYNEDVSTYVKKQRLGNDFDVNDIKAGDISRITKKCYNYYF